MRRIKRLSRRYTAIGRRHIRRAHPLRGHPFVVPVVTFMVLFSLSAIGLVMANSQTIGASDSRIVDLEVDGQARTVPTRAKTVGELLERQNIKVSDKDIVTPSLDTPILEDVKVSVMQARPVTVIDGSKVVTVLSPHRQVRTAVADAGIKLYPEDGVQRRIDSQAPNKTLVLGDQLTVDRATPVNINLYGTNIAVRTRAKTVGDLLDQKNIKMIAGDTIQPDTTASVTPGLQVFVVRVGKKVQTVEEVIPGPVSYVDDPALAAGLTQVTQVGGNGKKVVTYEIELKNGVESSRRVLQEVVAVKPSMKIIARGTKVVMTGSRADWLVAAGVSPSEYYAVDYIVGRESGWCPTKWQGEYGSCKAYHGTPSSSYLGYGLCQATPGSKMSSQGSDWAVNPVTQLKWCTWYARSRYGSWPGAYQFWVVNHWW